MRSQINLNNHPDHKYTFTGAGIITALELYYLLLETRQAKTAVRVSVYEKNPKLTDTTTCRNYPSLTFNEMLSVVPFGLELIKKLEKKFDEPGGIRVDDVKDVYKTTVDRKFKSSVLNFSRNAVEHKARVRSLLEAGKQSMQLWDEIYKNADAELREIFENANYNACREVDIHAPKSLHQGYRIDPIYNVADGTKTATEMRDEYLQLGAKSACILSPQEVMEIDPYLADFCHTHSDVNAYGELVWKHDAAAVWRPGGCLDTRIFLPQFFEYLRKQFGTFTNDDGEIKDCLSFKFGRRVDQAVLHPAGKQLRVAGLHFFDSKKNYDAYKINAGKYAKTNYVFCPGESVGTLRSIGFNEPDYAGFAGPSLTLRIPLNDAQRTKFGDLKHCMEVQQEGVVLAWQARMEGNDMLIGVAGTKAYYSDKKPHNSHEFALNRHLLQLNIVNNVVPQLISIALGRDTKGETLTAKDLALLELKGIADSWVGVRAVYYDGLPALGRLHAGKFVVENARTTTGAGSGGVSFAPVLVKTSRRVDEIKVREDTVQEQLLSYSDSRRKCRL